MPLDLKQGWSDADVSAVLAAVADDRDWRLEVDKQGIVALHDMTTPTDTEYDSTLHCFFEIWNEGTDFVGTSAASDKGLVSKIAQALRDNYPNLKKGQFLFIST
ncbi:MAG: hypothetical protein ACYCSS_08630 [Sulfuriferula sp.]